MSVSRWPFVCGALAACGTPPADGNYHGQPALQITGTVSGDTQQPLVAPSVGVLWVNFSNNVSQQFYPDVARIEATGFAGRFELDIIDLPDNGAVSVFTNSAGGVDAEIAFGYLMGFDDIDRNGTFMAGTLSLAPDKEIGLADTAVMYIKTAPAPDSELVQTEVGSDGPPELFTSADLLTTGFHLIHLVCSADGVPLGKTYYQVVDNSTTAEMVLFPASYSPIKDPQPRACLFVL
jgi:hypothetical protein